MTELMEVTLVQSYYNQQIINRFNYIATGTPAAVSYSFALTSALGAIPVANVYPATGMMKLIAGIQANDVTFQAVTSLAVYSETDFYSTGFNPVLTGVATTDGASPVLATGYRTTRTRRDIRRGTKRFVGISEGAMLSGGTIDVNNADLQALRVALGATLTYDDEGNTLTFQPCIVKKQKYNPPNNPTGTAYRYIPVADGGLTAQLADCATGFSWEIYDTARTQRSRQYGVGI